MGADYYTGGELEERLGDSLRAERKKSAELAAEIVRLRARLETALSALQVRDYWESERLRRDASTD